MGCTPSTSTTDLSGDRLPRRTPFGDDDIVVAVVVAVCGLSTTLFAIVAFVTAAPDDEGSFPVSSSLRILVLRSSNSSQTVDGAVRDAVDSVSST